MAQDRLVEALKDIGWSDGNASVYATLVEQGVMKPADLVARSGVAQGKIYTVLDELNKRGAIVKIGDRPALYDAQHPRGVISKEFMALQESKDEAVNTAEEAYEQRHAQVARKTACWTVYGMGGIQVQMHDLLADCKESVRIADRDLRWLDVHAETLAKKAERLTVELAVPESLSAPDKPYMGRAETRMCRDIGTCCLFDDKVVMARFESPDCALLVRDRSFAAPHVGRFKKDFEAGTPVRVPDLDA